MTLIILGLLIFIAGFVVRRHPSAISSLGIYIRSAGLILAAIGFLSSCIVQIGTGEVGVQILFGNVQNNTLASGLHVINPLMDVQKLDIKTQNYTMSAIHNEGAKEGDDAIRVLTADGLEVVMDMTVLYKVVPSSAPDILRSTGVDYTDKIVRPLTRTNISVNAVYYDAVALYSTKRDEFRIAFLKVSNRISKYAVFFLNNC
jgi:regulator of protease activity HflC (stomatin/prohibitin superfamily)